MSSDKPSSSLKGLHSWFQYHSSLINKPISSTKLEMSHLLRTVLEIHSTY